MSTRPARRLSHHSSRPESSLRVAPSFRLFGALRPAGRVSDPNQAGTRPGARACVRQHRRGALSRKPRQGEGEPTPRRGAGGQAGGWAVCLCRQRVESRGASIEPFWYRYRWSRKRLIASSPAYCTNFFILEPSHFPISCFSTLPDPRWGHAPPRHPLRHATARQHHRLACALTPGTRPRSKGSEQLITSSFDFESSSCNAQELFTSLYHIVYCHATPR